MQRKIVPILGTVQKEQKYKLNGYCNLWPRNGLCVHVLVILVIMHKCIYIFILWLKFLLVCNGLTKQESPPKWSSVYCIYTLSCCSLEGYTFVVMCRSRSSVRFTLCIIQWIMVSANTEFLCDIIFDIISVMHKYSKIVIKFWIRIKRTDRLHRCPADTNK